MTKKNFKEGVKFDKGKENISDLKDGVKFDSGKERFDLIPSYPLFELAKVFTYGCQKYDANNWRKGLNFSRIYAAIMRHLWKFWSGEDIDPESGLCHLSHAFWGICTLLEFYNTRSDLDDRWRHDDKDKKVM